MAKSNKFGAFGGVFTPSILTILGVIMYMRLPMIIGQAGLWATIGIILIAHIISISTGLSVSSIATDKKVKAGGTYYIISRSMGLPIGGTLGLALFVGLSFSVSLYLIGFAESFLGVWNIPITLDNIRITGSIILLSVTIITFISTSLALKTQYFIMAAIVLSLLSILLGKHEFTQLEPHFFGVNSTVPIMVLFGIFFPAVTGFEAGVSMSGDLKDPKKSIPLGTIAAIAIGLVVYICLSFFLAYTVSGDSLANDPNVLLKISKYPQLVIAGIWGATLSSALGSILAAPRILQATAKDKITPRFFARGAGATNEPRNALLLTFLIAEAGILIGDLDIIARIVSVFFITTYGFLNLSAAFEAATSADFRPSFKTPVWVSLLGALAAIIVMIQLDFVALLGAIIILGLLFLFLKRRQLSLEGGDTWSSVWASLVKTGIEKLNRGQIHHRNWRPNIILFSGSQTERPHLVELGNAISGSLGMITGFDLEVVNESNLVRQRNQLIKTAKANELIFYKHGCIDIPGGIDEIIRVYGFTGIEPNTIVMGWSKKKEKWAQFVQLINLFEKNNYNIAFLNYDYIRGFGEQRTIDVWWKGQGKNLTFAINIIRHLTSSTDWKDAKVRLMIVVNKKEYVESTYSSLNEIIDRYRVTMDVHVIDNSIDAYPWEDIVKKESSETDLTMIGLPSAIHDHTEDLFDNVDLLKLGLGSVLLIKASPQFEGNNLILEPVYKPLHGHEISIAELPPLVMTKYPAINDAITKIDLNGQKDIEALYARTFKSCYDDNHVFFDDIKSLIETTAESLNKLLKNADSHRRLMALVKIKNEFYFHSKKQLESLVEEKLINQKNNIESGISNYIDKVNKDVLSMPKYIKVGYDKNDFKIKKEDPSALKWFKTKKHILHPLAKTTIPVNIKFQTVAGFHQKNIQYYFLNQMLNTFQLEMEAVFSQLRPLYLLINEQLDLMDKKIISKEFSQKQVEDFEQLFADKISTIGLEITTLEEVNHSRFIIEYRKNLELLITDLERIDAASLVSKKRKGKKADKAVMAQVTSFPELWYNNSLNYFNKIYLDLLMQSYKNRIIDKIGEFETILIQEIEIGLLKKVTKVKNTLGKFKEDLAGIKDLKLLISNEEENFQFITAFETLSSDFRKLENDLPESLTMEDVSTVRNPDEATEVPGIVTLPIRKITGYVIETQFMGSVNNLLGKAQESLIGSIYVMKDLLNLTRFNLVNINTEPDDSSHVVDKIVNDILFKFSKEEEKIIKLKLSMIPMMMRLLDETFLTLSSYKINTSNEAYSRFSIGHQSKYVKTKFNLSYQYLTNNLTRKTAWLLYSKSEGVLFAKHFIDKKEKLSKNENILDFIEKLNPNQEVIKNLPPHYTNLFSGKSSIVDDFWIPRPIEEAQFNKAINRFHHGIKGGIMLLGERNSGKTALSKYITKINFPENKIHQLFPIKAGSVSREDFKNQLQKTTGIILDINEIFDTLPKGSVIVIHDLELWWERTEQGFEIVQLIMDLMAKFDYKCLFIINMNPFAYQLINDVHHIEHQFISVIECQPFNSEDLKDLILRRHESSGLKFHFQDKDEDDISEITLARLFNRYFEMSKGNPGAVLFQWLSNIISVKNETIQIKTPAIIDMQPIEDLDDDTMVVLVQLLLNKRMPYENLELLLGNESGSTSQIVDALGRTGLFEDRPDRLLQINPYAEPMVRSVLKSKGLV